MFLCCWPARSIRRDFGRSSAFARGVKKGWSAFLRHLVDWGLKGVGGLTAAGSGEEVVPASDYRALQNQVRELDRWKQRSSKRRSSQPEPSPDQMCERN